MNLADLGNIIEQDMLLSQKAAEQISRLIIDKRLVSGDKLPNEFQLATMLNVGRGTIREAIKLLVARNVLVIRRGKGTFIARHPGEIGDPLGFAFYPDQTQLGFDLLEIRIQLEPQIAALAAQRATKDDLENLRAKCHRVEQDIREGRDHLANDIDFHTAIAQCTKNMVVPKLIPIISYAVGLFGYLNGNILLEETMEGHREITAAICDKDSDAARDAMFRHLEENKRALEQLTQKMNRRTTR